jgi:hypothetical protein
MKEKVMSPQEIPELLEQARADLMEAQCALDADPTDEFLKMSVDLFWTEVESFRQILMKSDS